MKIDCPLENYLKKGLHDPLYSILRVKAHNTTLWVAKTVFGDFRQFENYAHIIKGDLMDYMRLSAET